ncbi:MAG: hypothetical protein KJ864_02325 [Candidatus Omnitrophica bacterium]|nr:hypothetical protein [Candidatus Omnitrophota bacterium]
MQKHCKKCGRQYEITDDDLKFYDKISPVINGRKYLIPPPALCPDCRQQRRLAFRNEKNLYHRKCDLCGKEIISMYSPDKPYQVYCQSCFWSDKWSADSFASEYNENISFFEQYHELQKKTPKPGLLSLNVENSEYCNFVGDVKNSYLIFGPVYSEDCLYGSPYYSKDCIDTLVIRDCELCYECTDCRKLYSALFCQDCTNCSDLIFCYDLQNCKECIGCSGLRNKEYHIFNKPYKKEEYSEHKKIIDLCNKTQIHEIKNNLSRLKLVTPRKYMQNKNVENVNGDHVYNSKNTFHSFFADKCEDCSYCAQVVEMKDCHDCNYTEEDELCYEYLGMYTTKNTSFSIFCRHTFNVLYSDYLVNVNNSFGCSCLKNSEYSVLNKKYSKEEYEKLIIKIIGAMIKRGEWGEFPPIKYSLFNYNETVADEFFPLTKEEALNAGFSWKDEDSINYYQGPKIEIPENIKDVNEDILKQILTCEKCSKNYRLVSKELEFYKKMNIPVPRKCFTCRNKARVNLRNPRKLWARTCFKCGAPIKTSYSPDRPETVYCEDCYLKEVY